MSTAWSAILLLVFALIGARAWGYNNRRRYPVYDHGQYLDTFGDAPLEELLRASGRIFLSSDERMLTFKRRVTDFVCKCAVDLSDCDLRDERFDGFRIRDAVVDAMRRKRQRLGLSVDETWDRDIARASGRCYGDACGAAIIDSHGSLGRRGDVGTLGPSSHGSVGGLGDVGTLGPSASTSDEFGSAADADQDMPCRS